MVGPTSLLTVPHDAVGLVNASPPAAPSAKAQVHILAVRRRKKPVKTLKLNELVSIDGSKTTGGKQGMTGFPTFCLEIPAVKAVLELQIGRVIRDLVSVPVIAPRRHGKNVGRFEMPD